MGYVVNNLGISSKLKKERELIHQNLVRLLTYQASNLEPTCVENLAFIKSPREHIYKISNMETRPFGRDLKEIDPEAQFFACNMYVSYHSTRIRKFSLLKACGITYLIFQQDVDYSNRLAVINTDTMERVILRNMEQIKIFFNLKDMPLERIPLLINDPYVTRSPELKKVIYKRIGYTQ